VRSVLMMPQRPKLTMRFLSRHAQRAAGTSACTLPRPGWGSRSDSDLGQIARRRLSTVYMPGQKITMLPEAVVDQFTLAAGRTAPAISLYLDVAADLRLLSHRTQLDRITIADNLRHHDIEPLFNATTLTEPLADFPYRDELTVLWEFSQVLAAGRGQQDKADGGGRKDYNFVVDWDANVGKNVDGPGRVSITERPRGSPLDTLVAELMIFANATWGAVLRDAGIPALYRVQTGGKVRMSTVAAAHEGLGVDCYAWSSSPLRRYADLVNQWQLIAWLRNESPSFAPQSTELFAALRDFELTYAAYAEFQRHMERYWCLRYLAQTDTRTLEAVVIKESLVRVMGLPLVLRVASLPDPALAPRGARVRVAVEGVDLLAAEIRVRFVEVLAVEIVEVDVVEAGEEAGSELEAAVIEVEIDTVSPVDKDAASEG
jgi:exoribonuclease-2